MNISISVVIPTYNRNELLLRAINSVLNQNYAVSEILVCDDGSNDTSCELIMNLNEPRIKWIDCGRNGRPSIPRNIGIRESKSQWIAFLDSDDEWLPDKIEKQVEIINQKKALAVCSNANRIIEKKNQGNYLNFFGNRVTFSHLLHENFIVCSSVILNKKLIDSISYFAESEELKAIEDYDLWLKISTVTDFYYIKDPLLNYFDNPNISIRNDSHPESIKREIIFNSLKYWKKNYCSNTPNFNNNKLYRAHAQTIVFKIESVLMKALKKLHSIHN